MWHFAPVEIEAVNVADSVESGQVDHLAMVDPRAEAASGQREPGGPIQGLGSPRSNPHPDHHSLQRIWAALLRVSDCFPLSLRVAPSLTVLPSLASPLSRCDCVR